MLLRKILKSSLIVLIMLLIISHQGVVNAKGADNEIPGIIVAGLNAYKTGTAEAAMKQWLKDSPMEGEKSAQTQADIFHQIETYYGRYVDYELIQIDEISSTAQMVYVQVNYESGPTFAYFLCYRKGKRWIIPELNFNTTPQKVLPVHIFE